MTRHCATRRTMPDQSRDWVKVADPFIVHGHRLSSLYRRPIFTPIPFIVLKTLKRSHLLPAMQFEYFKNNDGQRYQI